MPHNILLNLIQRFSYLQQYLILLLSSLILLIVFNHWWCIFLLPLSTFLVSYFIKYLSNRKRTPLKVSGYIYNLFFRKLFSSISDKPNPSNDKAIEEELDRYIRTILAHYITVWYYTISTNQDFPNDLKLIFKTFLDSLIGRLKDLNCYRLIRLIINLKRKHLEQYLHTVDSYRKQRKQNRLSKSLVEEFSHVIGFHPALAQKDVHSYLKAIVELIVTDFIPDSLSIYSLSRPGREFLTQLFVNSLLTPILSEFSKPATLYKLIITLFETEEDRESFQRNEHSFDQQTQFNTEENSKPINIDKDAFENSNNSNEDRRNTFVERIIYSAEVLSSETAYNSVSGSAFTVYAIQCETKSPYIPDEVHRYTIRRRFREFLNLHKRLQQNPVTCPHCDDLDKIFRGLPIPMDNMNSDIINRRKAKLEIYIRKLIANDVLNSSHDVLEFLAYNSDPNKQFELHAPSKLPVPRVDRVLLRTLSGVGTKINNLFPQKRDSVTVRETFQLNVNAIHEYSSPIVENLRKFLQHFLTKTTPSLRENLSQRSLNLTDYEFAKLLINHSKHATLNVKETPVSDIPLTDAVLDLVYTSLHSRDAILSNESVHQILRTLLGHFLEELLRHQIDDLLSEEKILMYLNDLRTTVLWPANQQPSISMRNAKYRAYNALINKIPFWLQYMIGVENTRQILTNFIQCLNYEELNRDFLCNALDLIIEELIPDLAKETFLEKYVRMHANFRT